MEDFIADPPLRVTPRNFFTEFARGLGAIVARDAAARGDINLAQHEAELTMPVRVDLLAETNRTKVGVYALEIFARRLHNLRPHGAIYFAMASLFDADATSCFHRLSAVTQWAGGKVVPQNFMQWTGAELAQKLRLATERGSSRSSAPEIPETPIDVAFAGAIPEWQSLFELFVQMFGQGGDLQQVHLDVLQGDRAEQARGWIDACITVLGLILAHVGGEEVTTPPMPYLTLSVDDSGELRVGGRLSILCNTQPPAAFKLTNLASVQALCKPQRVSKLPVYGNAIDLLTIREAE
jgi:hypothetical protein